MHSFVVLGINVGIYKINMEVSMKSKLFLSLSLLTAVFSVTSNEDSTRLTRQVDAQFDLEQAELANKSYFQPIKDSMKSGWNTVKSGWNTVATKSSDLYSSVTTKASDMYANATYENMKNASVNGFNSTKTFVQENPYKTVGGVAAVAALTYGAYKLYNSEMFAKSKAPVVTPAPVEVKKPKVIYTKSKRSNFLA